MFASLATMALCHRLPGLWRSELTAATQPPIGCSYLPEPLAAWRC